MASPLLTTDEMSTLRGGWGGTQKYCYYYWCGYDTPCDQMVDGYCLPGGEIWACDTIYRDSEVVDMCVSTVQNQYPCTQGAWQSCGYQGLCDCYKPGPYCEVYWCRVINLTKPYSYRPCIL